MPDFSIYHQIGAEPGEFLILEVPVGPVNLFRGVFGKGEVLQYYAPIHHKQLINGIVSRLPSDGLSRFLRSPLLTGLTGEYDMPPFDAAGRELADKLNVKTASVVPLLPSLSVRSAMLTTGSTSSF